MKIVDIEENKEKIKFAPSDKDEKNNMLLRASFVGKIANS